MTAAQQSETPLIQALDAMFQAYGVVGSRPEARTFCDLLAAQSARLEAVERERDWLVKELTAATPSKYAQELLAGFIRKFPK